MNKKIASCLCTIAITCLCIFFAPAHPLTSVALVLLSAACVMQCVRLFRKN